jgi:integrase
MYRDITEFNSKDDKARKVTRVMDFLVTAFPNKTPELERFSLLSPYVTDAEFGAVYQIASPTLQRAMDLATITGQREGDLLRLTRSQLTDEGIAFRIGSQRGVIRGTEKSSKRQNI